MYTVCTHKHTLWRYDVSSIARLVHIIVVPGVARLGYYWSGMEIMSTVQPRTWDPCHDNCFARINWQCTFAQHPLGVYLQFSSPSPSSNSPPPSPLLSPSLPFSLSSSSSSADYNRNKCFVCLHCVGRSCLSSSNVWQQSGCVITWSIASGCPRASCKKATLARKLLK